ncbi:MAG: ABC transporter ATP-binding protein [Candidatus Gallimonas sp.]
MAKRFVSARGVFKTYVTGNQKVNALNGLDFEIDEGEFAVILGQSGAGKTTLLNVMGGMDSITAGNLYVDGVNLRNLSARQLTEYRRRDVGFVFQFYNLMPNLSALENVELATELSAKAFRPESVLKSVGLGNRMQNFPGQLSGGEQQRVSIARAIAKNPKILLCDEPTGALDYETGKLVLSLLQKMSRRLGKTVIIVTHNAAIKDMADRVVYIRNGACIRSERNPHPKDVRELEW